MSHGVIYPGQAVIVEIRVRLAGVPTDPVVLRCLIQEPDGSHTTLTYPHANLTKRDTGLFEANVLLDAAGTWVFRGEALGTVDGIDETAITVADSPFV